MFMGLMLFACKKDDVAPDRSVKGTITFKYTGNEDATPERLEGTVYFAGEDNSSLIIGKQTSVTNSTISFDFYSDLFQSWQTEETGIAFYISYNSHDNISPGKFDITIVINGKKHTINTQSMYFMNGDSYGKDDCTVSKYTSSVDSGIQIKIKRRTS